MTLRIYCPSCSSEVRNDSNICPSCGAALDDIATRRFEAAARIESKQPASKPSSGSPGGQARGNSPAGRSADNSTVDQDLGYSSEGRVSSSSPSFPSIDDARFVPGTILANRYRIVGLLGKGGMGEVYRADDLKLGQPVALKFLPDRFLSDGAALARFHREVRVARQVTHKHVCRVYDIGEVGGHHFLSMEYIKGEELSSLLRRIGRLPSDKAVQIARQICAGLAAAHETGVLHRDLKPANVMIDAEGNARITDFGIAGLAGEIREDEVSAGTPAYMSPEQLEGSTVTVRSDIYSLGLVFYELFTGKRAFVADSLPELIKLRRSDTTPTTPTSIVQDLDPLIEQVILRCTEKDPARRPSSALLVAAALPGGDPLAAALAAGETPSPEMVAAAPKEGMLRPAVAVSLLCSVVLALIIIVLLAHRVLLFGYVPLEKSPAVLIERAREIIRQAGYASPPTDHTYDFVQDRAAMAYLARSDTRPGGWQDLKDGQPAPLYFWYRQSPAFLGDFDFFRDSWTNPPPIISGMAGVKLDLTGRLLSFYAVPPQVDPVQGPTTNLQSHSTSPNFETLFSAAGLNKANFRPSESKWAPLYQSDTRVAWEGVYPEQPSIPIRIEAASRLDKPVYFEIVNPWSRPERQEPSSLPWQLSAVISLLIITFILVLIGSVLLAIKNLRLGRSDRKGALRLALFVFTSTVVARLFAAHHVPSLDEFGVFLNGLQDAVFAGGFFWIVYVALEPLVRKRWPGRIISWTRLLGGDFRDPLIGRDVLIGGLLGLVIALWQLTLFLAREWLGDSTLKPALEPANLRLGMAYFPQSVVEQFSTPLLNSFQLLFLVLLLSMIVRRDWLGFIVGWLVFAAALAFLGGGEIVNWLSASVTAGIISFVLFRYGLLAVISCLVFLHFYLFFPVTTNLTSWYATGGVIDLLLMLALAFAAFYTSLGGQSPFSGKLLQE